MSKSVFIGFVFTILFSIINLTSYILHPIEFGHSIVGWDELQWQDSSIYFFENGLGIEQIKFSLGIDGGFNNLGWPYFLGLFHHMFGIGYFNVVLAKMFLYFLSVKFLYDIMKRQSFHYNEIILTIIFITFYHPTFVIRLTYLRDDFIVYLIIILLGLTSKIRFNFKSIVYILLFLFFSYILLFTRPFAYFVYLGLNFFFFRISNLKYLIILSLFTIFLGSVFFDIYSYAISFLNQFRLDFTKLIFDSAKFYIGPLPWQMFGVDSGYNPFWYFMSLSMILFFSLFKLFYKQLYLNWQIFLFLYVTAFMPYHISSFSYDAIGPRQFGMIAPFLFIILYLPLVSKLFCLKSLKISF